MKHTAKYGTLKLYQGKDHMFYLEKTYLYGKLKHTDDLMLTEEEIEFLRTSLNKKCK